MAVDTLPPESLSSQLCDSYVACRNDLEISRHVFFGETSYVVRDPITFEGHRLSPLDYEILTSLDDSHSLAEVFEGLVQRRVATVDKEEKFYRFVVELQKRNLLSLPITDGEALHQKLVRRKMARSKNLFMKALFLRIPLGNPDRFLKGSYHLVSFLFTRWFFVLWMLGFVAACAMILLRWDDFTSELASILAFRNLPVILLILVVLKLWHELGHGYACRHFGVTVPSVGLLLMLGTPLAFVDASGSWSLPMRRHRQVINLAGVYFEMIIAIIAAFVWSFSDDAWTKSVAHYTLLVSSLTTIAFNINPLMKYDGYFVLADLIGIPNLKSRSTVAVQALAKRFFFGLKPPANEPRRLRFILVTYGVASTVYKILLVIAISMMMATKIWIVGVVAAGYYLASSCGSVLLKTVKFLCYSSEVENQRTLAITYLVVLAVAVPTLLLACPIPGRVQAKGIAEHESLHVLHLQNGGFVTRIATDPGEIVQQGDVLAEIENIDDTAKWNRRRSQLAQLRAEYKSQLLKSRLASAQTALDIEQLEYELANARVTSRVIAIESPVDGQVISSPSFRTLGGYREAGEEIFQIGEQDWIIRAVANARSVADIKPKVGQIVHCRFHSEPSLVLRGRIKEISVSGSRAVQHPALTQLGGGIIAVDPTTLQATEPFFEMVIDIEGDQPLPTLKNGLVCEIRFERTHDTLGKLLLRSVIRFRNQIGHK